MTRISSHSDRIRGPVEPLLVHFLVVMGLSLHEVFEGKALGWERTEAEVWQMLAAISSHKFVIVFCIGRLHPRP